LKNQEPPRSTRRAESPYSFRHHSQTLPAISSAPQGEAPSG
jgi:hypothetical protein